MCSPGLNVNPRPFAKFRAICAWIQESSRGNPWTPAIALSRTRKNAAADRIARARPAASTGVRSLVSIPASWAGARAPKLGGRRRGGARLVRGNFLDHTTGHDPLAVVEHERLPGRHGPLRLRERDRRGVPVHWRQHRRRGNVEIANLAEHLTGGRGTLARRIAHP